MADQPPGAGGTGRAAGRDGDRSAGRDGAATAGRRRRGPARVGRASTGRRRDPPRTPRPRDALGRPLPHGVPGVSPLPDDEALPPEAALRRAQELLDSGLFFQAHEVLEAVWKAAPAQERELWRGLTQLVVGLTHAARGNRTGARALLDRGARRLAPYLGRPDATRPEAARADAIRADAAQPEDTRHGIDLAGLLGWAEALAGALREAGAAGLRPPRLTRP